MSRYSGRLDHPADQPVLGAEAMVAYLKLLIAKMKRQQFGQSAERGRKLPDQLELQLEELEAALLKTNSPPPRPCWSQPQCAASAAGGQCARRCRRTCRASACRASAALSPVLWRQTGQTRRGCHRDPRGRAAAVEGDPDRAREVHLPVV
jgi:hypothetical protein